MIEASFAAQYGIRLSEMYGEGDMPWQEFSTLISGLSAKSPLGNIVSIRAENDRERLKHFTPEQHRIRNEWRSRHNSVEHMTEAEKAEAAKRVQDMFASMFGNGGK